MTTEAPARKRRVWPQADLAALIGAFHKQGADQALFSVEGRTPTECQAKLVELGLTEKPERETLQADHKSAIDRFVGQMAGLKSESQRVLAIRYARHQLEAAAKALRAEAK